jgi:hypothetical protein
MDIVRHQARLDAAEIAIGAATENKQRRERDGRGSIMIPKSG